LPAEMKSMRSPPPDIAPRWRRRTARRSCLRTIRAAFLTLARPRSSARPAN
jgi:hypothetical protein